jgi:hypothetical protein
MVMVHDWCYAIECYNPPIRSVPSTKPTELSPTSASPPFHLNAQEHGPQAASPVRIRISPVELERRLSSVARDAAQRLASGERAVPVGVLSSDGRDRWAEVGHPSLTCVMLIIFPYFQRRTTNTFETSPQRTYARSKRSINPYSRSVWITTPTHSRLLLPPHPHPPPSSHPIQPKRPPRPQNQRHPPT